MTSFKFPNPVLCFFKSCGLAPIVSTFYPGICSDFFALNFAITESSITCIIPVLFTCTYPTFCGSVDVAVLPSVFFAMEKNARSILPDSLLAAVIML